MKNADEKSLKSCFADSAILQTILKNNQGKIIVKNEFVNEFAAFIGGNQKIRPMKELYLKQ